jgi:hypothetical protein
MTFEELQKPTPGLLNLPQNLDHCYRKGIICKKKELLPSDDP